MTGDMHDWLLSNGFILQGLGYLKTLEADDGAQIEVFVSHQCDVTIGSVPSQGAVVLPHKYATPTAIAALMASLEWQVE